MAFGFVRSMSIRSRLRLSLWTFALMIAILVSIDVFATNILSSVRAYVGGEGLWSKGQKDAVYNLVQYAYSEDPRDLAAYHAALAVPLADHRARVEMEKRDCNDDVAAQAFIEGRNAPEDVDGMVFLFRTFRHLGYIERAVAAWEEGDAGIAELQRDATELQARVASHENTPQWRAGLLRNIDVTNRQLTAAEDRFSFTLGEAARWLRELTLWTTLFGALFCVLFGLSLASLTTRQIVRGIQKLREGTARVSNADLVGRISVETQDELGDLAVDFNRMVERLVDANRERAVAEENLAQRAGELERTNQQLVEAQSIAKIGSWEWDVEKNEITWSDELYKIYGQSRESFSRQYEGFLEHIHPEDRERIGAVVADAREKKTSFSFEHRVVLPNGEVRWVHGQGRAIANAEGKLTRMAGTTLDITERVLADEARVQFLTEKAARKLAQRQQARAEILAEAGALLAASLEYPETVDTISRLAVPRFADLCVVRLAASDLPSNEPVSELITHSDETKQALLRELRTKHPEDGVTTTGLVHVVATGKSVFTPKIDDDDYPKYARSPEHLALMRQIGVRSMIIVPMVANGTVLGAIAFGISERPLHYDEDDLHMCEEIARRAAFALENARLYRVATAAVATRDEFLSVASHELRTPLTPLQLQLEALERGIGVGPLDPKVVERLGVASRQVKRIIRLVDGLLDVTRLSAGRLSLIRENTDLSAIVRDVVERFSAAAKSQSCDVEIYAPAPVKGFWDPIRIDQIVMNLVSNALKYGARHKVEIHATVEGKLARLVVRDSGIGVEEEHLNRIFERYERAAPTRAYGGLGLGLYIAKQLVEAHDGTIVAKRNEDVGMTFTVELPTHQS